MQVSKKESTLRVFIGVLGILLPVLLWLVLSITDNYNEPLPSISHYFYSRANPFFSIVIGFIALSLIIYKGYNQTDFVICTIAGIAALVVVILPTNNLLTVKGGKFANFSIATYPINPSREKIHLLAAGLFLICLAVMSAFQFTKTDKGLQQFRTKQKIQRNRIYILSAIVIIIAILCIGLSAFNVLIPEAYYNTYRLTFWFESIAVWAFGFSWLVKGEFLLKDKN